MARIQTGKTYDDSKSETELTLHPESRLEFEGGDLHNNSQQSLKVRETLRKETTQTHVPPIDSSSASFWAKGSFLLVAFIVVGAVIGTLAQKLKWYAVPVSVLGAIAVLYLISVILVPHGPLTEKGLLSVLQPYLRLVFAIRPTTGENDRPGSAQKQK
ncbi:MAG: hypothetical protein WCA10_05300 [Terracidiphilus sp.]